MKIITMDTTKCVGCRNCELACAYMNSNTSCERTYSKIRVNHYIDEQTLIPLTCLHCEEAWCLNVCPAAAISRDENTGAVIIDSDKCAGCKMCILACPYGNIQFDEKDLVSTKCNLCEGNPRCVGHCVGAALNYEDVESFNERARKKVDRKIMDAIKHQCKSMEVENDK